MQRISFQMFSVHWKCSLSFCITTLPLQVCKTKRFLEYPTRATSSLFWLLEKKHPPTRLLLIKDFPSVILCVLSYVLFCFFPCERRYRGGQWTPCCVRTAVTLTNLLLHVWSLLNVHADGMRQAERKHLKTLQKMSKIVSKTEQLIVSWSRMINHD